MGAWRCLGNTRPWRLLALAIMVYALTSFSYLVNIQLGYTVTSDGYHKAISAPNNYDSRTSTSNNGTQSTSARIPTLRSLLNFSTGQVIGDPQFLLKFAIVGHGKCGTTSISQWLAGHAEVHVPDDEVLALSVGTHAQFLHRLYMEYKRNSGEQRIHGYKNPGEIRIPQSVRFLNKRFPRTVLVVGIRHPVPWFESLFNFKVQNLPEHLPSHHWGDPNRLIGVCDDPSQFNCVGTHKGLFHVHLAFLGKTNQTKALEARYKILRGNVIPTANPVFLFDVDQLHDSNATRRNTFEHDVQDLLGLGHGLGPPPRIRPGKVLTKRLQADRDKFKIRICDDRYIPLRTELVRMAREASGWIRTSGFLDHPDVRVSSQEYLEHILETRWMKDPCDEEKPNVRQ